MPSGAGSRRLRRDGPFRGSRSQHTVRHLQAVGSDAGTLGFGAFPGLVEHLGRVVEVADLVGSAFQPKLLDKTAEHAVVGIAVDVLLPGALLPVRAPRV